MLGRSFKHFSPHQTADDVVRNLPPVPKSLVDVPSDCALLLNVAEHSLKAVDSVEAVALRNFLSQLRSLGPQMGRVDYYNPWGPQRVGFAITDLQTVFDRLDYLLLGSL